MHTAACALYSLAVAQKPQTCLDNGWRYVEMQLCQPGLSIHWGTYKVRSLFALLYDSPTSMKPCYGIGLRNVAAQASLIYF